MSTIQKNQQERRAKRFGVAMDRWIWRFCLVLLIGATAGVVVQSLIWQARTLVVAAWSLQSAAALLVYVVSFAVLVIEVAGFYVGDRLWVHRRWRRLRPLVGFIGIIWFGSATLWFVLVPPWLDAAVFGIPKTIDTVIVMVFAAMYGVFNWSGLSFRSRWYVS